MDLKDKKVLVIGGAGLIGSHVVEEILKEPVREVVVYDNFSRGTADNLSEALKDSRCRIFELGGDVCQPDLLDKATEGCDAVVHLAALWLLHCHEFPQSAFEVNIRGTFNVLQSCVKNKVKRLVYSSSASVYGDAVEEPMTEDHPYNNWTFYGASKIAGEHMLKAYTKRYGLEAVGLRYMNVYGPRQDYKGAYIAVMMKILDCIDRGIQPQVYGDGSQAYDFVHVRDCARANVCALKGDVPFGFYNVGRGVKTSIKELAELLLELSGSDLGIKYEPAGQTFVTNRLGCIKAAERDLGYRWSIDLREGMQSLIDWRNNHKEAVEARRKRG
ncbi:SDR family NAD(P)-dependent oxidoreductase [Heliobacterium undosum]|uniref:SDR family NAD(P)-dependent oxidoreductase n=1 Tax=Heliomicrobium undosum TaxID=121734 RepID=A0A845L3T9_9FIRM|nr:SDR family NAD(P)-dependent oxidoreductase [Heliomicrobium undosum]MZP29514.1 SDR family NAD(P)-dependent oxidoreductase [Heliomicrobium undosum]